VNQYQFQQLAKESFFWPMVGAIPANYSALQLGVKASWFSQQE
jgi:hypothetical protein